MIKIDAFHEDFENYNTLMDEIEEYREAGFAESEAEAKKSIRTLIDAINYNREYARGFEAYRNAQVRGNEYLNIDRAWPDEELVKLVRFLRTQGVKYITVSGSCAHPKTVYMLQEEARCEIEGALMINSGYMEFMTDQYEKQVAFLLRIKP